MRLVHRQHQSARRGRFAWLGAVAVVLLQLQLATHLSADHDTLVETDETCEVCLKLDASGKVPAPTQPLIPVPREQATLTAADRAPLRAISARAPSARAPPRA